MPLQEAVPAAPITDLPAPAGGLEYDVSMADPEVFTTRIAGAVTTGAGKGTYVNASDEPKLLRVVRLSAGTAPAGADLIVDVNVEGTTAFSAQSARPKIVAGAKTGSAVPAQAGARVLVRPNQTVTVDVDQVGSGTAGSDLVIAVELVKIAEGNKEGVLY